MSLFISKIDTKKTFPTAMLDFMFLFNSSVNTLYNEGTANIQCYILKKFLLLIYIIDTKKYF